MSATEMQAGRETDALVAERVMGWADLVWYDDDRGEYDEDMIERNVIGYAPGRSAMDRNIFGAEVVPAYSTDIAAAWEVVEAMRAKWAQQANAQAGEPDVWRFFDCADEGWAAVVVYLHHDGEIFEHEAHADTLPLAICRAALAALESA